MIDTPTATSFYVYGAVRSAAPRPLDLDGIAFVESGPLAAITGKVSLDEFGEEPLKANLNDRTWLEAKARAHEDVLLATASVTDVVPFRFGTICHSTDDVRALLDRRCEALVENLDRLHGRVELGVKLWVDRERLAAVLGQVATAAAGGSGRNYLEARRSERDLAATVDARGFEVAHGSYERLADLALADVANRPQPRELTGRRTEDMLLNAAFLVEADDRSIVEQVAQLNLEYEALGFTFELTGPWPAHNFVKLEEDDR